MSASPQPRRDLALNPAQRSESVQAKAFEKAARAIENIEGDLETLVASGAIYDVSGVGKATGKVIEELARTGQSEYLEELRGQYPPGIFELLRVPKLGLKKIGQLYTDLGIASIDDLEAAARDGRIARSKARRENRRAHPQRGRLRASARVEFPAPGRDRSRRTAAREASGL